MLSNYKKYGALVIGVDFDFTIKCPIEHFIYNDIVDFLKSIILLDDSAGLNEAFQLLKDIKKELDK